ncbi:D-sedoheptulose 7-phosphate isomerase [Roseimicrobium gellanilyticum]|uniref:Phosphoheptose isomerase n=1 Tax=Roseimicrobium gellanilyticum TaxID=748857 RepID=A0A366H344_9BACT|nr:D-sedoheptulose 7-phosphate isomerase [Roseimicrobium gellanilyticum]RBP36367.1 D-sedoheptulose 7-phosphate isomerase [Roseimicrobium gellanilyticum]
MSNAASLIETHLTEHHAAVQRLSGFVPFIEDLAGRMVECLKAGGKVLFFGNGGSAADAQHLAAELVVRYRVNRRALAGIALTTDTSILTAGGNDFGFDSIYARQVEALGCKGDVVIGISTSGNSANVVNGLVEAKKQGCLAVAFTAEGGGRCAEVADLCFRAPSPVTARAQECHLLVGHILCDWVEKAFAS